MKIIKENQMNEILETSFLVSASYHPESFSKEEIFKNFSEHGISGDKIYEKFRPILEKYISAFQEQMVQSENDLFFFEEDSVMEMLTAVLIENRGWLTNIDEVDEHLIYSTLANAIFDEAPNNIQEVVSLLQKEKLEPTICWKLMLIFENPKQYMIQFVQIVNQNLPAYHHAMKYVQGSIAPLMDKFEDLPMDFIEKIAPVLKDEIKVRPTLVALGAAFAFEDGDVYVGLFFHEIYQLLERQNQPQENIAPVLKVLGDSSKFEILRLLKQAPKYNLEIAQEMGLTPATTSHHMNVLLSHGLVTIEKRDGKVYYSIEKNQIQQIISDLEVILL